MTALVFAGVRLIDGTGAPPRDATSVAVADGAIAWVGPAAALPGRFRGETVEAAGRTLMPGLIDAHTHLTYHAREYALILQQMNETLERNTVEAVANARRILETGCTAIGDGGCRGGIAAAIRDGVAAGSIEGPKVVAAGQMLSGSGGIGDHAAAWGRHEDDSYLGTTVDGADEVRRAVRRQVRAGVDWIKVTASGTPGNPWIGGRTQDLTYPEIRAAVEEAAKFGKSVHAHAHDPEGLRDAVRAGVISLHSGEYADEAGLELMAERGCVLLPTLAWLKFRTNEDYARAYNRSGQAGPEQIRRFVDACRHAWEASLTAIAAARRIGTPIGLGSDGAHVFPPYDPVAELEALQDAGLSPLEAVTAATGVAARALGRSDIWGTIEVGKAADLLLVDGDPSQDVRILRDKSKLLLVLQEGRLVKDCRPVASPR